MVNNFREIGMHRTQKFEFCLNFNSSHFLKNNNVAKSARSISRLVMKDLHITQQQFRNLEHRNVRKTFERCAKILKAESH